MGVSEDCWRIDYFYCIHPTTNEQANLERQRFPKRIRRLIIVVSIRL